MLSGIECFLVMNKKFTTMQKCNETCAGGNPSKVKHGDRSWMDGQHYLHLKRQSFTKLKLKSHIRTLPGLVASESNICNVRLLKWYRGSWCGNKTLIGLLMWVNVASTCSIPNNCALDFYCSLACWTQLMPVPTVHKADWLKIGAQSSWPILHTRHS